MLTQLRLQKSTVFIPVVFFLIFLVTGLSIYKDYGLNWDEDFQQYENGIVNYNFIFHGDRFLEKSTEKYHGPAFEVLIIALEKVFHREKGYKMYFFRHLINFISFYIACIFFFLLSRKLLKNTWLALLSTSLLILSPRIFADAFINSKDIPLLSFYIIAIYTQVNFLNKPTYKNIFLHALAIGLVTGIRISGLTIPIISIVYFVLLFFFNKSGKHWKKELLKLVVFISLTFGSIVLFWPILWTGPIHQLPLAFAEMKAFPWTGEVLYMGKAIKATLLPWHYIPIWLFITTPIIYTLFFIIGCVSLLIRFIKKPLNFIIHSKIEILSVSFFFLPLIMVFMFHPVLYDGWRHLFFIYPWFIIIAMIAVAEMIKYLKSAIVIKKYLASLALTLLSAQLVLILYFMVRYHPNQQVYFNESIQPQNETMVHRWELDYWGHSYYQAIEYLLKNVKTDTVKYCSDNFPGELNFKLFSPEDQKRLQYSSKETADYFLANFRFRWQPYEYEEIHAIKVKDMKILVIYKLR